MSRKYDTNLHRGAGVGHSGSNPPHLYGSIAGLGEGIQLGGKKHAGSCGYAHKDRSFGT